MKSLREIIGSFALLAALTNAQTHASNGVIYCTAAGTDPDGDGWGWENNASCIVRNSTADPDRSPTFQGCIVGTLSYPYCATDNGSWGTANGAICISKSFCPTSRSTTQSAMSTKLVDPLATASAQKVFDFLRSVYGKKTISGQQDQNWDDSIDQYQRVITDTGKAPAIMGYDFMNYGLVTNGWTPDGLHQIEEAITHWGRGGLVTFAWHWRVPDEFYSDKTSFQIPIKNNALDTTSGDWQTILKGIQTVTTQLKRLQDAGVAVLWRPLHEASGGWFWWGRTRSDGVPPAFAQVLLYRYLYKTFTQDYGLHNLIWVHNGQGAAWYPGDDVVDVVSTDIYDGQRNYVSQKAKFLETKAYPSQQKLVALSENSNIPDPSLMASDGAVWLWFCTWSDIQTAAGVSDSSNFWTGEYYNTNAHKKYVYTHPNVITLSDLPSFTGSSPPTTTPTPTTTTPPPTTTTKPPPTTTTPPPTTTTKPPTTTPSPTPSGTAPITGLACNYEGQIFRICRLANAWSYENGSVCVGITRCVSQSPPYGVFIAK